MIKINERREPISQKSSIGPKKPWYENEIIAVTTQPPATFESLMKYPMPIMRRRKPEIAKPD